MGKFKKGLFLGGLFGASMVWMSTTKKGREMKDKLMDQAADIYLDLKDKVIESNTYGKVNRNQYIQMAQEAVDKYAVKNGMADKTKKMMVKLVSTQWSNLKRELHKDCNHPKTKKKSSTKSKSRKKKKKS